MKCTDKRCLAPEACESFGYCRNHNKPFQVTRFWNPPILEIQLAGAKPGNRTIEIWARNKTTAERLATENPDWFSKNAFVETSP